MSNHGRCMVSGSSSRRNSPAPVTDRMLLLQRVRWSSAWIPGTLLATVLISGCGDRMDGAGDGRNITRLNNDLLGSGSSVTVADSIAGDAYLAGGEIGFTGSTQGDLLAAGGNQNLAGSVQSSLRAAGGQVNVSSNVARNITVAGGTVIIDSAASVAGNAYLFGGEVTMDGDIAGSLMMGAGQVSINGRIGGDARIESERLTLGPDARIEGKLTYRVPEANITIDPGAQIIGERVALPERPESGIPGAMRLWWALGFLVAGSAAVLLFPRTAARASSLLRTRPGSALGLGLLYMILLPITFIILLVTVVGIPLAIILLLIFLILLYLAAAVPAIWLGRMIFRWNTELTAGRLVLAFLAGGAIVSLAGMLPVVGWFVTLFAIIGGAGALMVSVIPGLRRDEPLAATPA